MSATPTGDVTLPPNHIGRGYLYRDLGEALEKQGDLPGAIAALRKALTSWPLRGELYCSGHEVQMLGRLLEKNQDAAGAIEHWKAVMTRASDGSACQAQLARLAAVPGR